MVGKDFSCVSYNQLSPFSHSHDGFRHDYMLFFILVIDDVTHTQEIINRHKKINSGQKSL